MERGMKKTRGKEWKMETAIFKLSCKASLWREIVSVVKPHLCACFYASTMFGVNNTLNVMNNKLDTEEENISEHEHTVIEIIWFPEQSSRIFVGIQKL